MQGSNFRKKNCRIKSCEIGWGRNLQKVTGLMTWISSMVVIHKPNTRRIFLDLMDLNNNNNNNNNNNKQLPGTEYEEM